MVGKNIGGPGPSEGSSNINPLLKKLIPTTLTQSNKTELTQDGFSSTNSTVTPQVNAGESPQVTEQVKVPATPETFAAIASFFLGKDPNSKLVEFISKVTDAKRKSEGSSGTT